MSFDCIYGVANYERGNKMKKLISTVLMTSMMAGAFCACTPKTPANDPTPVVNTGNPVQVNIQELSSETINTYRNAYLNTSFDLLRKQLGNNKNTMISPASILIALSMAEAGANGQTKEQLASIWGGADNPDEQISYAAELLRRLNNSEGVSMHAADAMWINESILSGSISGEYVDFVREHFGAEINAEEFSPETVERINAWVNEHTDEMIDKILDELNPNAAEVLLNAIAFDGSWAEQYEDYQVNEGTFRNAAGEEQTVTMLNGSETFYLENELATGFIKYYEGGQYAYVVMLPKDENQTADEMLADFTGEDFDEFMASATSEYTLYTRLPEYTYDYECRLNDTLKELGVIDPFDEVNADFTGIANLPDGNLYIGSVIHKTHIELDRTGTRAAAVTAVTLDCAGAIMDEQIKNVFCDRPFAYAIVDMTDDTPVFIGTVNEI